MSIRTAFVEYQAHDDPFGVLVFDVNQFKAINDRFGHASGDRARIEVATTLLGALRKADIVGRWGGDEFLAIVHNLSKEVLGVLAERCVALVKAASFRNDEGGWEGLSISVGDALVCAGESVEKLIARADGRMYEQKKAGGYARE